MINFIMFKDFLFWLLFYIVFVIIVYIYVYDFCCLGLWVGLLYVGFVGEVGGLFE